ncbi:hypothetical protein MycrhDRAFT_5690 [Mycolicibacterium rhodesiae JS60]|nr:hypothetical protein MycrhDRAFT_5690 [Mycolicibacterium rhodesiae JS60]
MAEDWFTDPNWHDNNEVIDPGGAAAGPGAIAGGVPASLISNITNNAGGDPSFDWLHDFRDGSEIEEPLDAGGAAAGPGAIAGGVPGSLVSNVEKAENAENGTGTAVPGPSGPFEADYAELEKFAQEHDLNAQELAQWASGDPDFAERYLATHGKVNFGTYLKIKEFMISKQVAGNALAEQHLQTSTALRGVVTVTQTTDEANAAAFSTTRMV